MQGVESFGQLTGKSSGAAWAMLDFCSVLSPFAVESLYLSSIGNSAQ